MMSGPVWLDKYNSISIQFTVYFDQLQQVDCTHVSLDVLGDHKGELSDETKSGNGETDDRDNDVVGKSRAGTQPSMGLSIEMCN